MFILLSHVVLDGDVEIGEGCKIFPFATIGMKPQSSNYGRDGNVRIGAHVEIRENVTIHPGTEKGGLLTSVGEGSLLMIGAHVAHDCQIGKHVTLANLVTFAGHCVVEDYATLGGLTTAKQFTHIGQYSFVGGTSGISVDIPPFSSFFGSPAKFAGVNRVGLQRHGFSHERIQNIRKAFRFLYEGEGLMGDRIASLEERFQNSPDIALLAQFVGKGKEKPSVLLEESIK